MASNTSIGTIVSATGHVFLETESGLTALAKGDTIAKGAVIITQNDGQVEIKFEDDTVLSQAENSRIRIDDYVYDQEDATASRFLLDMAQGTLRTVTGKIAVQNPDEFKVKSPLATIGIRGTEFWVISDEHGDRAYLGEIASGHIMVVQDNFGTIRFMNTTGSFATLSQGSPMGPLRPATAEELQRLRAVTPISSLLTESNEDVENKGATGDQEGASSEEGSNAELEEGSGQESTASGENSTDTLGEVSDQVDQTLETKPEPEDTDTQNPQEQGQVLSRPNPLQPSQETADPPAQPSEQQVTAPLNEAPPSSQPAASQQVEDSLLSPSSSTPPPQPANTPPTAAEASRSTDEDTPYTFAKSDFGFQDADGDDLAMVKFTTLPQAGTLTLNGTAVQANQAINAAEIANLVFTPADNAHVRSIRSSSPRFLRPEPLHSTVLRCRQTRPSTQQILPAWSLHRKTMPMVTPTPP